MMIFLIACRIVSYYLFFSIAAYSWSFLYRNFLFCDFLSVLIAANDVIKISDFGTSREWNEKSTKMSFAGTVAWMAPEVIRNEPCSEKVDIWLEKLETLS